MEGRNSNIFLRFLYFGIFFFTFDTPFSLFHLFNIISLLASAILPVFLSWSVETGECEEVAVFCLLLKTARQQMGWEGMKSWTRRKPEIKSRACRRFAWAPRREKAREGQGDILMCLRAFLAIWGTLHDSFPSLLFHRWWRVAPSATSSLSSLFLVESSGGTATAVLRLLAGERLDLDA